MTISIDLFWALIILISLHTILHHLINWWFRRANTIYIRDNNDLELVLVGLAVVLEAVLVIISLNYLIDNIQ